MTFGEKIRALREVNNLSQEELSKEIGTDVHTIADWESDAAVPNVIELSRLCSIFSISADKLISNAAAEHTETRVSKEPAEEPQSAPVVKANSKRPKVLLAVSLLAVCVAIALTVFFLTRKTESADNVATETEVTEKLVFSEDTDAIDAADASVVTVFCYDMDEELTATGSGFVAFDGQTVVTNYHVMKSAYSCKITTNQDVSYEVAGILAFSKERDIAILKLEKDTELEPLTFGSSDDLKKGAHILAIGSPLGIKNTVSTGVISGRPTIDSIEVLQFTAPISEGSSGGALFDEDGNVVGVTFASYVDGQNLNLAIPIELVTKTKETATAVWSVSKIYTSERPYARKLERFKDAEKITIDELMRNPQRYSGKTVKVYGYFSSMYLLKNPDYENDPMNELEYYDMYFISNENDVTGEGKYDFIMMVGAREEMVPANPLPILGTPSNSNYITDVVNTGDMVCCVGKFEGEADSFGLLRGYLLFIPD